jgi:phage terminase large subunit
MQEIQILKAYKPLFKIDNDYQEYLKKWEKHKTTLSKNLTELEYRSQKSKFTANNLIRYYVYYGGRGGGKTYNIGEALVILATQKKLKILCTREIQASIRDSVHSLLKKIVESNDLFSTLWTVTDTKISCQNGSEFLFSGLYRNIESIKSLDGVDFCWIEEAENISQQSFTLLDPTIRAKNSKIIISFNPNLDDDFIYTKFVKTLPKNALVQKVNWNNNPFFPNELEVQRQQAIEQDYERYLWIWEGQTREIGDAQVFKDKFEVKEFNIDESFGEPIFGLDFGFAQDPTAGNELYIKDNNLYVYREAVKIGLELDKTAEFLIKKMPKIAEYTLPADCARPESINYLKRHGLEHIEAVSKWSGSVEDGIDFIKTFDKVIIHKNCVNTATEFTKYSYKVDKRSGNILPKFEDKYNHNIDAIRYALVKLIGSNYKVFDVDLNKNIDNEIYVKTNKLNGICVNNNIIATLSVEYDSYNDIIYISKERKESDITPTNFKALLKTWNDVKYSADKQTYENNTNLEFAGFDLLNEHAQDKNGNYSIEVINTEILERLEQKRIIINEKCNKLIQEINNYYSVGGKLNTSNTELIVSLRNILAMLRYSVNRANNNYSSRPIKNW